MLYSTKQLDQEWKVSIEFITIYYIKYQKMEDDNNVLINFNHILK